MRLITRDQWGARPYRQPAGGTTYSRPRRGVKVHYLGTPYSDRPHNQCDYYVRTLQSTHMDRNGWSDIGYSFVVCTHGYVYEGRGLKRRNSANGTTALNEECYAVLALVGSSGLTTPTDAQLHGLRDAIEHCREHGPAGDWIGGHRDGYATACPGDVLYAWVKAGAPRPGGDKPTAGGTYTVRAGDTLSSIGRDTGVSWQDIAKANGLTAPYRISPGQKLTIPKAGTPTTPAKSTPRYEPFPGAEFFRPGRRSPIITAMGKRLVAEGCGRYSQGPGPEWTEADERSYAAWQRKLGYAGRDADGTPGKTSWDRLRVPKS